MPLTLLQVAGKTKYPADAFEFVQRGLEFTVRRLHGKPSKPVQVGIDASRHVTGQDLALGLRDFAIKQYGLLARAVLKHWNIHRTEDFGRIVFAMVESGLMHKTEHDRLDDFHNVFDFNEAFGSPLRLTEPRSA
jgi:uncharacterized repeat protein (TIGR04138 family)